MKGTSFLVLLVLGFLVTATTQVSSSPLPAVLAKCERYTFCNGEMCDDICRIGEADTDTETEAETEKGFF